MNTILMSDLVQPADGLLALSGEEPWSETESSLLEQKLWLLLQRQFQLKTQGDSTSLRIEDTAELIESIRFTLQFHLRVRHLPSRTLLAGDIQPLFREAQASVHACLESAKRMYDFAVQEVLTLGSLSLRDTLQGIGKCFFSYDERLYAHLIPADIDYQLCQPIPQELLGVAYLHEYLQRLLTENALVTRFDPRRVIALLSRVSTDYGALLINLYEPVAANVVGLSLLGGGETLLEMTAEQGDSVAHLLRNLTPEEAVARITAAADDACRRLSVTDGFAKRYLADTAMLPRLAAAPEAARGVFATC